jgi:hypothetical protein
MFIRTTHFLTVVSCALAALMSPTESRAQELLPPGYTGPPVPVSPETIRRSPSGDTATIRASRILHPMRIDGRLEESVYRDVRSISDFTQSIPDNGQPATQRTEAWVFFDDDNLYVSGRCYDTRPPSEWMANEMRRDIGPGQDDFGIGLDTFYDRRNGYQFYTNPLGRRTEQEITNEREVNADFNPIWEVRTGRFEGGWTVEMAIPFKSLRYRPGRVQVWGLQIRRTIRSRNESSWTTRLPVSIRTEGNLRQSTFPTLVGIEAPPGGRNLELKPYLTGTVVTDRLARPAYANDPAGDVGVDMKYGVTQNLTLDLTVNPDVAQVEADDQIVNLTRFNVSFPEKREFFLEARDLFAFGRQVTNGSTLFYTRQIGLQGGRVVPIIAGLRTTGKFGRTAFGAVNVQTGNEPVSGASDTNFTVMRLKQDVLRRSSVGLLLTNRSSSFVSPGEASTAAGVDANFAFFENLELGGSYAKSRTPRVTGPNDTYRMHFDYDHDRYGLTLGHLYVADGFRPEIGFVPRDDLRQTSGSVRFSPRLTKGRVLQYFWTSSLNYITDTANALVTRELSAGFRTKFRDTQEVGVDIERTYDVLDQPFRIVPAVTIPAGGYDFGSVRASYTLAPTNRFSGTFSGSRGGFYGGDETLASYSGRVVVSARLAFDPSVTWRRTDLPWGGFTTQQYRTRITYTFTPLMFMSGLIQYNTNNHTVSTSLRLRWEYSPGSELFLAYTEEDDTIAPSGAFAALRNRTLAFKINRSLRF